MKAKMSVSLSMPTLLNIMLYYTITSGDSPCTCMCVCILTGPNSLPQAATCFNSISLPEYESKKGLKEKLELAIMYGQQTFLLH